MKPHEVANRIMKFLYLAYAATWTIHLAYLRYLSSRSRRLRKEAEELGRD